MVLTCSATRYLWRIKSTLKRSKVPKYYAQGCLKIFLSFSTSLLNTEVEEKIEIVIFLVKEENYWEKTTTTD